jgi:myo-inositol 2-dehydrogenase/D-chiro-inositol 1-dehydrogenase
MIGEEHVRRLTHVLSGAQVVALTDVNADRARAIADQLPSARVHPTGEDVVQAADVDAVVVTSWGPTHEEYVLASIAAGKPVFCEKPLATTREACDRILDAEIAGGRRLVQVGFMRRYDSAFRALKSAVDSGAVGAPTLMYSVHRNADVPPTYTSDMAINDTGVHDIDVARWLLDDEITAVRVLRPRRNSRAAAHLVDPLVVLLETVSGVLVTVEVNVNIGYGYDIRSEVVGETGTVALSDEALVVLKHGGLRSARVPPDWRERFLHAYDVELQEWVDAVSAGGATGPSAWDGYAAAVVSDSCLEALTSGERVLVSMRERPDFYSKSL